MTRWVEAAFVRGGTSKGLFFREDALPAGRDERDALFCAAMGSPDPYERQLDGMGGGISSLSKVVSVEAAGPGSAAAARDARAASAELSYAFGQVAVARAEVDASGNCGNLSAGVVPFALHAGLLTLDDGPRTVRMFNTNTGKHVEARLTVEGGEARVVGDLPIPGVAGSGSPVELLYPSPAGSRTSGRLPSGRAVDVLRVGGRAVEASLIDVAMPMVFVRASDVGLTAAELPAELEADRDALALLEALRRAGAERMGLARGGQTPDAAPKVAVVAPPATSRLLDGGELPSADVDLLARTLSMGDPHRAVPGTSAMCLAAAALMPGTLVAEAAASRPASAELRIGTPSGVVTAGAEVAGSGAGLEVVRTSMFRTARILMSGRVAVRG